MSPRAQREVKKLIAWTGFDGETFLIHSDEFLPRFFKTKKDAADYFGKSCAVEIHFSVK